MIYLQKETIRRAHPKRRLKTQATEISQLKHSASANLLQLRRISDPKLSWAKEGSVEFTRAALKPARYAKTYFSFGKDVANLLKPQRILKQITEVILLVSRCAALRFE